VGAYEQQGWIEPLDGWIEAAGIDLEDIYPAPLSQCASPGGGYACLPWGADTFALYWNKDLFAAAGLDPNLPPQTLEEILERSGALTARDGEGALSQVGFLPDTPRSHLDLYAHQFGGMGASAQSLAAALEWERGFYTQSGIEDADAFTASINRYLNSSHPVFGGKRLNCQQCHRYAPPKKEGLPDQGFLDGSVAMMVDGTWQLFSGLTEAGQGGFEFGVSPLPPAAQYPQGVDSAFVQGPVVVVPVGAADKDVVAGLLGWMMSPEIVAEMAYGASLLPSSIQAAQDARFQQIPQFQVFMDLMGSPYTNAALPSPQRMELNEALAALEKEVLHEGGDPAPLLDVVQAEFENEF
jgi:multiple sugar transport system substrate-binding protein